MLQRVPWNVRPQPRHRPAALLCFILVGFLGFLSPIRADSPIYKYEDDSGTVTFTEQWESIPDKYQRQVVTLNPQTLKPVEVGSTPGRARPLQPIRGEHTPDSVWNPWLNGASIPFSTQFHIGVGIISALLIVGMLIMRRFAARRLTRMLLKLVALILLGGTVYVLYFFRLNAEVSSLSGEPRQRTITGSDLKQTANTTRAAISETIQRSVVHPLQSIVEQSKYATSGQASRTVDRANAATTQMENTLKEIGREEGHADAQ